MPGVNRLMNYSTQGDVVVCVTRCEDRGFLIVRRSEYESFTGKWEFPGGIVEDEGLEDAALRELKEETGLEAEVVKTADSYVGEGNSGLWTLHPVLLKVTDASEVELSREHDQHSWTDLQKLDRLETMDQGRAVKRLGVR